MPIGVGGAAAISGAVALSGSAMQNQNVKKQSKSQRQWNLNQWNRQNMHDYTLNAHQNMREYSKWREENKYNSPIEQMARFKEAGLSPHLMYGKGTSGNASPIQQSAQRSSDVKGYTQPQMQNILKGVDVFGQMADLKNVEARTNNVDANTSVLNEEAKLKGQQQLLNAVLLESNKIKLGASPELTKYSLQAAEANLKILNAQVLQQAPKLQGMSLDNALKNITLNRKKHGIEAGDNVLLRMLMQPSNKPSILKGWNAFKKEMPTSPRNYLTK